MTICNICGKQIKAADPEDGDYYAKAVRDLLQLNINDPDYTRLAGVNKVDVCATCFQIINKGAREGATKVFKELVLNSKKVQNVLDLSNPEETEQFGPPS